MNPTSLGINDDPGGYMLKVVHNSQGISIERNTTDEVWEIYTSLNGNLWLYHNSVFRGSFDGSTGAYVETSDLRLKQDIRDLESVLDRVMLLRPATYAHKNREKKSRETLGFIAQEVQSLFPEVVYVQEDDREKGKYGINYSGFGPIAIKAIQELKSAIDIKEARIVHLEERLARIEQLLAER